MRNNLGKHRPYHKIIDNLLDKKLNNLLISPNQLYQLFKAFDSIYEQGKKDALREYHENAGDK